MRSHRTPSSRTMLFVCFVCLSVLGWWGWQDLVAWVTAW